jgi:hypothetical protein
MIDSKIIQTSTKIKLFPDISTKFPLKAMNYKIQDNISQHLSNFMYELPLKMISKGIKALFCSCLD